MIETPEALEGYLLRVQGQAALTRPPTRSSFAGEVQPMAVGRQRLGCRESQVERPMAQIDLTLAAELVVVLLLLATRNPPKPRPTPPEPPLEAPAPAGWSAATDPHAQRILRLERLRRVSPAPRP